MKVRPLEPDERDAWLLLQQFLWPDTPRADLLLDQAQITSDPTRNAVLVADHPEAGIIGFIEVSLRDHAEGCDTRPVGYIEAWYVQPVHRLSGIGRALIQAAESWARSRGCTEMASDTDLENPLGLRAHLSLGYSESARLIHFRKTLDP